MKRLAAVLGLLALTLSAVSAAPAQAAERGFNHQGRGGQYGNRGGRWGGGRGNNGGGYGGGYQQPQLFCQSTDNGWEEHAAHNSCGECKALHGACTETCYSKSYVCRSEGVDRDGRRESFEAYSDYSESDARNQALDRCYSRDSSCGITRCDSSDRVTSRRGC
ncbi:MAG: hypothetical protein AB7K68_14515 [Bacteriovoracia bacterium]